jgi:hypothetical protein
LAFPLTAGIIDQLAEEFPDPSFVKNATAILKEQGFNVTYHNETVDVAFYNRLTQFSYGIIILRAHAALRTDNSTVDLFTSEPYDLSTHRTEQDNGLLVEGFLNYSVPEKTYFAVTSEFIKNLQGSFPRSIVIAMGCNTLLPKMQQMAEAFYQKGAAAFIGWNGYVLDINTDTETLTILKNLVSNNQMIGDSIRNIYDTSYGSTLNCYPQSAQNLRISDLIPSEPSASLAIQDVGFSIKIYTGPFEEKPRS